MHLSLYFVLFQASMRGKSRETKANMRIKEALPGCDECVVTIYSTSEETNCIGDDGEFVCTRERHRKIILQWLMSKVSQVFYWILT
ncbi:BnaC05g36830D [Brassica napus]|uniref:BnaC05g36830D protein n=1 Tax=Brassica napus TaxID=3708 RepID=A0A078I0M4_BRANA|nr:BnaC05g36830D [Brassica napus]